MAGFDETHDFVVVGSGGGSMCAGLVLRKAGKDVHLVGNKAESKAASPGLMEAYSLGFGEPIALSAEHGVGSLKVDSLPDYKSSVALGLMQAIKRALDPHNRMNPGRVVRV